MSSSISLPPISAINFDHQPSVPAHLSPHDLSQQSVLPPARTLPPLPYCSPMQAIPQPEYVQLARPMYAVQSPFMMAAGRMPLPSSTDTANMMGYGPNRHIPKTKEVKRRTKTGCMTCRKRRIKCGEERPSCRNCIKSKRQCAGYEPVFQGQPSHTIQPTPVTSTTPTSSYAQSTPSRSSYGNADPINSDASGLSNSGTTPPRERSDYSFHRSSELPALSHINQGYKMENSGHYGTSSYTRTISRHYFWQQAIVKPSMSTRTIEDVCAINGRRGREVPALRHDLVPNFNEIRKVYDTFFAPGLDSLIETGSTKWFSLKGFDLLMNDRSLLAQFMLYLTLISNTNGIDPSVAGLATMPPQQAELASQEARMVWALLNLVVRQAQEGINDEDVDKFARRVKSLEALLTSEPVVRTGSMADFVYQDPEPEPELDSMDIDMSGIPTVANNPLLDKPFNKQVVARMEEFWQLVEKASEEPTSISPRIFDRLRQLRDGLEQRDIIYSIMLLGASVSKNTSPVTGTTKSNSSFANQSSNTIPAGGVLPTSSRDALDVSPAHLAREQEKRQAERLLESEARGRATNAVLQNLAGMGLRAFVR